MSPPGRLNRICLAVLYMTFAALFSNVWPTSLSELSDVVIIESEASLQPCLLLEKTAYLLTGPIRSFLYSMLDRW